MIIINKDKSKYNLSMQSAEFIDLEQLIAVMPGHVYWLNTDNVYLGCNDRQAKSFGLPNRYCVIGKNNHDLLEPDMANILNMHNLEVMRTALPKVIEEPSIIEGGVQVITLSHKLPLLNKQGEVIGLLGISLDITEHKRRETELKEKMEQVDLPLEHIVSHMPGHVYWKNKEGVYLGCNDSQAKTLGLHSASQVIGKTDFDLPWGKKIASLYRKNDLRIMKTGASEIVEETALINGRQTIYFLSQKTPLKNKQGDVVGILGISFDITEQKEIEKKLIAAKEEAESANVLKSEFIHNMEHDIRTPFSGILGLAKILDASENDPVKKQIISDISYCAQELLNYCCSILDFSKIEAGILPILAKKFNLSDLINNVIAIEMAAAKMKSLDFTVEYDDNVPFIIIGDEYRLKRILINLLSNAIKFTSYGFVKLKIKNLRKLDNHNVILRFIVEDSGIGIPYNKIDTVYEKFNRLTPSNLGLYKGQGLGLRIVKQFVNEMEGEIEIKSVVGKGSSFICTFSFGLPVF